MNSKSFSGTARTRWLPRSLSSMRRIIDRCFPWKYGNDYIPALLATRTEGPRKGRLHRIPMPKWSREMHFMSAAQARVAAHIIYQPNFIEGLENRPCSPISGVAILDGHPLVHGQTLPFSSGSVEISRMLGFKHPATCDDRSEQEIERDGPHRDFFPLTSDLLALFADSGTVRAVNLFICKREKDLALRKRKNELFLIERTLYAESRIPTVKISEECLDPIVTNNLMRLAKKARKPKDVSDFQLAQSLLFMEERL